MDAVWHTFPDLPPALLLGWFRGRGPYALAEGRGCLNIIRDYVNLRYRLLPTYYNLSHENYETGMPLVRRLDFEYPEYESAARNDQYLLGEDILIAPTITDTEGGDPAVPAAC